MIHQKRECCFPAETFAIFHREMQLSLKAPQNEPSVCGSHRLAKHLEVLVWDNRGTWCISEELLRKPTLSFHRAAIDVSCQKHFLSPVLN